MLLCHGCLLTCIFNDEENITLRSRSVAGVLLMRFLSDEECNWFKPGMQFHTTQSHHNSFEMICRCRKGGLLRANSDYFTRAALSTQRWKWSSPEGQSCCVFCLVEQGPCWRTCETCGIHEKLTRKYGQRCAAAQGRCWRRRVFAARF